MLRRTLPQRRFAETFDLTFGELRTTFQVSIGYFPPEAANSNKPAEVFITGAKAGSEVESVARDGAVLLSIALQYGVPIETIASAITRDAHGQPMTVVGAVIDRLKECS